MATNMNPDKATPPLRIALLGYGKMGRMIDALAQQQGMQVVYKANSSSSLKEKAQGVRKAQVAIEFTTPATAVENIACCITEGIPVVCGTTGWYNRLDEVKTLLKQYPAGACLYGPNFSLGINILRQLNTHLAQYRAKLGQYHVSIKEVHHIHKLDAPSGTALLLAEPYLPPHEGGYNEWALVNEGDTVQDSVLPITAERKGEVPGEHKVTLTSPFETLTLEHKAHGREGFAQGALLAAQFIIGKKGLFTFSQMLF